MPSLRVAIYARVSSDPQAGGTIARTGPSSIDLADVGTYRVSFSVPVSEAGQLIVTLNGADLAYTVERSLGERCAAEIRVHDHTGGVDDPAQARRSGSAELGLQLRCEVARVVTSLYSFTRTRDNLTRGFDSERIVALTRQLVDRRQIAQYHRPERYSVAVDGDFVVLGSLVEARQQCPSLRLDNGLLVVLAREGPHRFERLEPRDRHERNLVSSISAE